jgi:hypothetical protein
VSNFSNFVTGVHNLYDRYIDDWKLAVNSFWGGPEYRLGQYLKQYQIDTQTPAETINTYQVDSDGTYVSKIKARVENVPTSDQARKGIDNLGGTFYFEKLQNVPNLNYLKLYISEYNSMLFKSSPHRVLPETPEVDMFVNNVDGEGNSINEFWSQVDILTSVYGVSWLSCIKFGDNDVPTWRVHDPVSVKNWEYAYDRDGNLKLTQILIELSSNETETVYRYMNNDVIRTVFVGVDEDDEDYRPVIDDPDMIQESTNVYYIEQENPLGYIPCFPVYQNQKIYNGVGSTPTFDLAQIQRSVYGDMAEIYSTIAYSAHPSLVVDEETDNLNNGELGAEPGSIVRVPGVIAGQQNYTYEFKAPPLTALSEIRALVDQKIEKMNQLAMIRSDELIKASRSGEQIREYDAKMESFIRKKATNLENAEYNLWQIWFDWTNQTMPEDFSISYNRQYNTRAVEKEIDEISKLINVYEKYDTVFYEDVVRFTAEHFATVQQAEAKAVELGGAGHHQHELEDGTIVYMPFPTHAEYELRLQIANQGTDYEEGLAINAQDLKESLRDQLRQRLEELLNSTGTHNSL